MDAVSGQSSDGVLIVAQYKCLATPFIELNEGIGAVSRKLAGTSLAFVKRLADAAV